MISSKLEGELLYGEDEDDEDDAAQEWVGKFACRTSGAHGPAIAFSTNGDTLAVMGGLADGSSGTFAQSGKITLLDTAEAADGKLDVEPGPMVLGVGNAEFVAAAFADGVVEGATEIAYVDTDGDSIAFKRKRDGTVDYWVNGEVEIESISSLSCDEDDGQLHVGGRNITTPQDRADSNAVMELWREGWEDEAARRRLPVGRAQAGRPEERRDDRRGEARRGRRQPRVCRPRSRWRPSRDGVRRLAARRRAPDEWPRRRRPGARAPPRQGVQGHMGRAPRARAGGVRRGRRSARDRGARPGRRFRPRGRLGPDSDGGAWRSARRDRHVRSVRPARPPTRPPDRPIDVPHRSRATALPSAAGGASLSATSTPSRAAAAAGRSGSTSTVVRSRRWRSPPTARCSPSASARGTSSSSTAPSTYATP